MFFLQKKNSEEKLDVLLASRKHGGHQYHIDSRAQFSTTFHCNKVGCTGAMVIYNGERLRLTALHTCKADKSQSCPSFIEYNF